MQGGVGDCTNEIALALQARGVEVSVLTSESARGARSDKLRVLPILKKWDRGALSTIRKTFKEYKPDLYHIQYQAGAFGMHPMITFAPRLLGHSVKSVVTFHDLLPMYLFPKAGPVRDRVTFQFAQSADAVIATNAQDYTRLKALRIKRLALIPIGSNIDPTPPASFDRASLRKQLGIGENEILLCYFGFLNETKGAETLVRALTDLPNAKLLMLGGQTGESDAGNVAYRARVKAAIASSGLDSRVIWTDFMPQPQVSAHFLAADICVLPYRDGVSFRRGTFMAALAHGKAIVTTEEKPTTPSNGKLPMLRDGENILLIPSDDAAAIVRAVLRIESSPALRAKLEQGALDAARFFTWDTIADAHIMFYQDLLA